MNSMTATEAACIGKQPFTSPRLAHKAANRRPGRGIYKCRTCGLWHVGQNRPKKTRDWRKGR